MTKQRKPEMIFKSPYRGYAVNVEEDEGRIIYKPIIDNTFRQLEAMRARHKRVFTFRFDLHLPDNPLTNNRDTHDISSLFNKVTAHLKKKAKKPRVGKSLRNHKNIAYQWVKEKGNGGKHHFHCWIAVDGNINYKTGWPKTSTQTHSGIAGLIAQHWEELTAGTLVVANGERMLTRTDRATYEECIYHYSYIAKIKDKYHYTAGRYSRNHGCSHLSNQSTTRSILGTKIHPMINTISPRTSSSLTTRSNRIKPHIRDIALPQNLKQTTLTNSTAGKP